MKAILRFLVTALAVMVSLGTCSALASTGTTPKPEPEVSFSTPEVDFRYQLVGTTSPQISQVVTNAGSAPLAITAMDVTGEDAADFATSSNFTLRVTMPPGQSVTVNVTFAPGEPWTPGTRRATLKFTDTDGPQFVSLTGMGVNCGGPVPAVLSNSICADTDLDSFLCCRRPGPSTRSCNKQLAAAENAKPFWIQPGPHTPAVRTEHFVSSPTWSSGQKREAVPGQKSSSGKSATRSINE